VFDTALVTTYMSTAQHNSEYYDYESGNVRGHRVTSGVCFTKSSKTAETHHRLNAQWMQWISLDTTTSSSMKTIQSTANIPLS